MDFETFDHYEIWESVTGLGTAEAITSVPTTGPGVIYVRTGATWSSGKYTPGQLISIEGSDGNDGDYLVTAYQSNGGLDEIVLTVTKEWNNTGALGNIVNMTHYWEKDTTKSTSKTIKNLTPKATYYYKVRAIDKYGNPGFWSDEADCGVSTTKPTKVEGLR